MDRRKTVLVTNVEKKNNRRTASGGEKIVAKEKPQGGRANLEGDGGLGAVVNGIVTTGRRGGGKTALRKVQGLRVTPRQYERWGEKCRTRSKTAIHRIRPAG